MSIQLGILLILASHPDGFATVASINADMRVLSSRDWSHKLRELARRVRSPISIFRDGLVVRGGDGWHLTEAGRQFVASLISNSEDSSAVPALRLVVSQNAPAVEPAPRDGRTLAKTA